MQTVSDYALAVFFDSASTARMFLRWLKRFHNNDNLGNETKVIVTNLTDYRLSAQGRIYKAQLNRYVFGGVDVAFCYVEEMDVLVVYDPELLWAAQHTTARKDNGTLTTT
jgi:hypothetical protein